jgi:DNA repair exonuclease SbcCD ATPase subunit
VPLASRTPAITEKITKEAQAMGLAQSDIDVAVSQYDEIIERCAESEEAFQGMTTLTPQLSELNNDILMAREQLREYEAEQRAIAAKFDDVVAEIEATAPKAAGKKPSELVQF